jgi:anhydro-N-acetylmuramic acid kinase
MSLRVIGLISGTSVDGIDAALVEISGTTHDLQVDLLAGATYPYPAALRSQILAVCGGKALSMAELAELDDAIAWAFAEAALQIQSGHPAADLIGSHGQTVFHRPPASERESDESGEPPPLKSRLGYSLQLGRGALIANLTGITTISNFRAADIAVGGQGAPMVPPVDACLLRHERLNRCIQNIGGIGNVAYLPAKQAVVEQAVEPVGVGAGNYPAKIAFLSSASSGAFCGWDTGPGNALIDLAVEHLSNGRLTFDRDGAWAAQGVPCQSLVQTWLQQDFFQQSPPKSTGRELFGQDYLQRCLEDAASLNLSDADILASLTEFTAASIADSYRRFLPRLPDQVLLCGGGSRNLYLRQRLQANLGSVEIGTTEEFGVNSDFKEAIAFAVLAYWRHYGIPGNLPEVTGARQAVLLGEIHQGMKNLA